MGFRVCGSESEVGSLLARIEELAGHEKLGMQCLERERHMCIGRRAIGAKRPVSVGLNDVC
jgi:hypothetical protein